LVDGDHPLPIHGVRANDRSKQHEAGVVDQDVEPTKPVNDSPNRSLSKGALRYVCGYGQSGAASLRNLRGQRFQSILPTRNQSNGCAEGCKC
jgi:hypothetical protein